MTPRYCRRQLLGLTKRQASQPCLTNLTLHIPDTTAPNAEPGTKIPVLFAYANKAIIVVKRVRDPLGDASRRVYAVTQSVSHNQMFISCLSQQINGVAALLP